MMILPDCIMFSASLKNTQFWVANLRSNHAELFFIVKSQNFEQFLFHNCSL